MKFQGSKVATLECMNCTALSEPFRVFFFIENDRTDWQSKQLPDWWFVEEETEIYENGIVLALCPKCKDIV